MSAKSRARQRDWRPEERDAYREKRWKEKRRTIVAPKPSKGMPVEAPPGVDEIEIDEISR